MINTKILLSITAVVLGLFGFLSSFFSQELLLHTKVTSDGAADLFIQLMAALFLGFAIMNWMNRGVIMGGIYARHLAMGNFSHFLIGFFALAKMTSVKPHLPGMWVLTIIYFLFAVAFGVVMFFHPVAAEKKAKGE
ncbi:MAG: hypothetical protein IPJ75_07295 [Ignavibacteriales bacterium]|nr:hypothetical protein [Ignavibacteriales bacterium]